jgi:RecA DNA recombination protein
MPDVSAFTMSPIIWAFPAQLSLGDFQARLFGGPRTATGRPRLVIVIGSPRCSISSRNARHLALNSEALTTLVFMPADNDSRTIWSSDYLKSKAHLTPAQSYCIISVQENKKRTKVTSAALQSVLYGRFADLLQFREKPAQDALPSGIPDLEFPRGAVTEIYGPPSSGRTTLLLSALAQATAREEVCALVDVDDAFDPASAAAAGVALNQLLWVRCGGHAERALKVTDLLVHGGGFGMVAIDLGHTPPETARRIPPASWFRFRHAVQNTNSLLLVLEQGPYARSCAALSLEARREAVAWSGAPGCSQLLRGMRVHVEQRKPWARNTFDFCLLTFDF